MIMEIPGQFKSLDQPSGCLQALVEEAQGRLLSGETPAEILKSIREGGWPDTLGDYILSWIQEHGAPDDTASKSEAVVTSPQPDEKENAVNSTALVGMATAESAPVVPHVFDPMSNVIMTTGTPAQPTVDPEPAASAASTAETAFVFMPAVSPIASGFPDWDLLPPQTLVNRIKRSL